VGHGDAPFDSPPVSASLAGGAGARPDHSISGVRQASWRKGGCRWQGCPPEYGPYTTVYNRFNRWSVRGIWQQIFENGITPVIPGRESRKKRIRYDKEAYKGRNVIERSYCRLKDFRRIATRYDKLARNFFSQRVLGGSPGLLVLSQIESGP
jgi:transposase